MTNDKHEISRFDERVSTVLYISQNKDDSASSSLFKGILRPISLGPLVLKFRFEILPYVTSEILSTSFSLLLCVNWRLVFHSNRI